MRKIADFILKQILTTNIKLVNTSTLPIYYPFKRILRDFLKDMSDKENQEMYDADGEDYAVGDTLDSAVRKLIAKGKKTGYISMEELNRVLPQEKMTSDKIEDIMSAISDMGINIISDSDIDGDDEDRDENDDEYGYDGESDDIEEGGNIDAKDIGRSDDPVRMYLKEMGLVELLSREGEIAISKRIEAGKTVMIGGLCESPMTIRAISGWRDELVAGTLQLRDIIDLEMMYGDDSEAMVYDDDSDNNVDLEKVTKELNEKNLDEIDDDLSEEIELDNDDVDDEPDEDLTDDMDEADENADMDSDSDDDNSGNPNSTSISTMESTLLEPVLETLNKISGYYDDLKKVQSQRMASILSGRKISQTTENKYLNLKKELIELMSSIHLNSSRVEQ